MALSFEEVNILGNIINDTFIRELWVSRSIKKQIIVARVQTPWISLTAQINSSKEN